MSSALALGYGRTKTGRVGKNSGYDAYALRTTKISELLQLAAKLTDTGKKHGLSVTQDHGTMEGRPIIREATLKEYRRQAEFCARLRHGASRRFSMPLYPNPLDNPRSKSRPPPMGHVN